MITSVLWIALSLWLAGAAAAEPTMPLSDQPAQECADALRRAETALQAVSRMPEPARTFANTPEALENALQDVEDIAAPIILRRFVSTSSAEREAGAECESRVDKFLTAAFARPDLFRAVSEYAARREALAGESRLLLDREIADFNRAGAGLDRPTRAEIAMLEERIERQERTFRENLEWPVPALLLSADELAGTPPGFAAGLPAQGELRRLAALPALYRVFMASALRDGPRVRLEFAYHSRAPANGQLLKEILLLRLKRARLAGLSSYARQALAEDMISDPERKRAILDKLRRRLLPRARTELSDLTAFKAAREGQRPGKTVFAWDRAFLTERRREPFDETATAELFPSSDSVRNAFTVLEGLLGLRLRPAASRQSPWDPAAQLYEARDADTGELLGRLYLDLYARAAKPERPAVYILSRGRRLSDGRYRPPECVILAGWKPPPATLRHGRQSDLEDFFHAMGHALAVMLSRARYGRFSGAGLANDFTETPALMLSRLPWQPEIAVRIASRADVQPAIFARALRARAAGGALAALEDVAYALYDLRAHSVSAPKDPGSLYREFHGGIALLPTTPGTHPDTGDLRSVDEPALGGDPIVAGLAAEALWRRLKEEGLANPATGRRLRQALFEPGAGKEAVSLRNFLGHPPLWNEIPDPACFAARAFAAEPYISSGPPGRRRLLR
jgi:Zn-dependent oligopeptidase